jgi:hypothetical protein
MRRAYVALLPREARCGASDRRPGVDNKDVRTTPTRTTTAQTGPLRIMATSFRSILGSRASARDRGRFNITFGLDRSSEAPWGWGVNPSPLGAEPVRHNASDSECSMDL